MTERKSDNKLSENNKRIAKNTILLYGRMLLTMLISLFTSRVILNSLGVIDYGIVGVVGGIVSLFSILSGSLTSAISRFITIEIGRNNLEKVNKVFCTAINVQVILIVIIVFLAETIGIWFLNNKVVIPAERISAAQWAYQLSIITFSVNLLCIPYNATIIAHERMSAFAYITIFDVIAKLIIAYAIYCSPIDRMVFYCVLVFIVGIIQRFLYTLYCKRNFSECCFQLIFDKYVIKEMFGFAGWNFIGASANIMRDQGGNIVINMFFGPSINAARAISMSVNNAVNGFVANFQMALNPQITKYYASQLYDQMFRLAFQGARLSFYILLILALPILFTAPFILKIWLGNVPEHSANFVRLILIFTLNECLSNPIIVIKLATGKIRNYQLTVGGLNLLNLPISYILLNNGYPPEITFIVMICISVICLFTRLIMLRNLKGFSVPLFLKHVIFNVLIVSLIASIFPLCIIQIIRVDTVVSFILICIVTLVSTLVSVYIVGCNIHDRIIIKNSIKKIISKFYDKDR